MGRVLVPWALKESDTFSWREGDSSVQFHFATLLCLHSLPRFCLASTSQ